MMRAQGQSTVWRSHIEAGLTSTGAGWYRQLRDWWAAYNAVGRGVRLATLNARRDSQHEIVQPLRAAAAPEMAVARAGLSVATLLYGISG